VPNLLRRRSMVLVLMLAGWTLDACGVMGGSDTTAARQAAEQWLNALENREYERTWDEGSKRLQKVMSKGAWVSMCKEARETRGALVSREPLGSDYRAQNPGYDGGPVDTFVFSYRTTFERKAAGKEQISVVREPDGKWRAYIHLVGLKL